MDKNKPLMNRKHPRLNNYDYSSNGVYFITICTQNRQHILSHISDGTIDIQYTPFGEIAEQQLLLLEERYPYLAVDKYVIMPNHIHAIIVLNDKSSEELPRPAITDILCAYKSLTTRECKKNGFEGKLFQTSFYEHIIRDRDDYGEIVKYICENPVRWHYKMDSPYTSHM